MKTIIKRTIPLIAIFAMTCFAVSAEEYVAKRKKAEKLQSQGNYKEALVLFKELALGEEKDPTKVGQDMNYAINCYQRLNQVNKVDEFRERVIVVNKENWHLLRAAAQSYLSFTHYGYIIAGKFERGHHRGGGEYVNSFARDRVRGLQLLLEAKPILEREGTPNDKYSFYDRFANGMLYDRGYSAAWRLQYLSDLKTLPDYDKGYYWNHSSRGAPVTAAGSPVFYKIPASFAAAANDGERWRWLLDAAVKAKPDYWDIVDTKLADFLWYQFGVQTMAYYGRRSCGQKPVESGPYAVHTLTEDETIAKLANGIKRFKLPEEFNFVKIYQRIAEKGKNSGEAALTKLTTLFLNRRQYPKAAKYLRENIKRFGPGYRDAKKKQLAQIVGNWGKFELSKPFPAGNKAELDFRFRNTKGVSFTAHRINVKTLLKDLKDYLKKNPKKLDWQTCNIGNIGYRIVTRNETKYLGKKVAEWSRKLQPKSDHFDKQIVVTPPMTKAGAYLVTAQVAGGNTSRIIVWLSDSIILKKPVTNGAFYFVADAITGKPIPKAQLNVFGYRQKYIKDRNIRKKTNRRYNIETKEFDVATNDKGMAVLTTPQVNNQMRWLVSATNADGNLAFLGFRNIWISQRYDREYNQNKTFVITDRPVYRPEQKVHFKAWIRKAQYDMANDVSSFANQAFTVIIRNPKREEVFKKTLTADQYGGVAAEYDLPEDAALGNYYLQIHGYGGSSFRVEEYKKPEYEVKVEAPKEPVKLGDKITATIDAKYYFGAPVTEAKVKYKVLRYEHGSTWYPWRYWNWLYNPGYWWFSPNYDWYPGWGRWGCKRPWPWWNPRRSTPPEVVMENEVEIGPDGKVKVEIDSAIAKALFGDRDHRYEITAEVVDQSRRTIVGKGSVIAAKEPFKVYAWIDRGYFRVGDTIQANFSARTVDGKGVKGVGDLKLLKITYDAQGKPKEVEAQKWKLDTNDEGVSKIQIKASEPGQYRLAYTVTDAKGNKIEGGYIFNISGKGFNSDKFQFNDLEIVNDKAEYLPGEKAKLMINTNRSDSTVLFFARPANGVYLPPKLLSLKEKTAFEEVTITKKDMPNFFVEAVTIANGQIHTVVREMIVPPEKKVLNVEVKPSETKYKPGQKAKVKLKITDFFGKPVQGAVVATVYDKSVEYISGGSNVKAIKDFFWKWRRRHKKNLESSLDRHFRNLLKKNELGMNLLGVFGNIVDQTDGNALGFGAGGIRSRGKRKFGAQALSKKFESKGVGSLQADLCEAEGQAMPSSAPRRSLKDSKVAGKTNALETVHVRSKFADTAYWAAELASNAKGELEIELDMPENLTTWKIKVWSLAGGTRVGQGETEVVTSKDFLLRLQAPRYFVETDEVTLSAIVHNYLPETKKATVALELGGDCLKTLDETTRKVEIESNGETRVDWRVQARREGEVSITMKAVTNGASDAMKMTFPVLVHGIEKMVAVSGNIRPEQQNAKFAVKVPEARRIEESRLEIRYSPTLAMSMVDALPYLAEYPYGCTEQTLNRFLPTVITQKILKDMGLNLADIEKKRTNLNAQEIGDDKARAKQWKRYKRNPVFSEKTVKDMVREGIKELETMQISDGGWGWFSGYGEYSYPHTTALVVHGLQIARANGATVPDRLLKQGVAWLKAYQERQVSMLNNAPTKTKPWKDYADNIDAMVYMVLIDAKIKNQAMLDYLYRDRTRLSVYAMAMYGLALNKQKIQDKLAMVMRNISQYLVRDKENQTAYLNLGNGGYWWYWYGSEYEAQAYYLKLLAATDPKSEVAPEMVKYLLNNRKHATYWNSTRDTAICVEAFADYLRASGETDPDMTVELLYDGKVMKTVKINKDNLFSYDNKLVLSGKTITSGEHNVEIRRKGKGPVYFNSYLTYFSLEDFITKAGLEVKVNRKYYKLTPVAKTIKVEGSRGQAVDQKVEKYERSELANLATLKSGDLVEVELIIDSKNDYEYLIFADWKPAGFEACEVRSGYNGNAMNAYVEFRDEKVCFFVRTLARGKHSVNYRMRAEIPGKFSALPTQGYAMYAPELKGNSDEIKLKVVD